MVEGRVIAWSKKVGDKVSINEMLLVIRTPNIDLPVRALIAGTVTAIATTPGQSVAVGDVLCWIDETRPCGPAVQTALLSLTARCGAISAAPAVGCSGLPPAKLRESAIRQRPQLRKCRLSLFGEARRSPAT